MCVKIDLLSHIESRSLTVLDRSRDLAGAETEAGATILTGAETGAGPEPE